MSLKLSGPLVLAGAGRMGGALLDGMLARGLEPSHVTVLDPNLPDTARARWAGQGVNFAASADQLDDAPAVVLAAVKPQVMDAVMASIAPAIGAQTVTLSVAAGRPIARFEAIVGANRAVVRAMPNTPAAIGKGMTVCVANAATTDAQKETCTALLAAVGSVAWVDDEDLIDAVTGVSGSGPAYIFHLVEAMAAAGTAAGLSSDLAMQLARATVIGAGAMLDASDAPAATLRENVTSPGGTTAAALQVLMRKEQGLIGLMTEAVAAAEKRGRELAG